MKMMYDKFHLQSFFKHKHNQELDLESIINGVTCKFF